jgi:hypothetical protein
MMVGMNRKLILAWLVIGSSGACVATPNGMGGQQVPVANAAVSAAIAGGVAAERRREGGCYTPCTPGNVCNPKTGYCEPIPCGGECPDGQACLASALIPHCVPSGQLEVRKPGQPVEAPPAQDPLKP